VLLVLSGCGRDSATPVKPSSFVKPANAEQASDKDRRELARGNNEFALALYDRLRGQEGNLFFSPFSVSAAFGTVYGGACGETADEMAKVLRFSLPAERLHPAFAGLLWDLAGRGQPRAFQLDLANGLWGKKDFPFRPEFVQLNRDNYSAGLEEMDFTDPEADRKAINAWVAKNTGDKIGDLLPPEFINPPSTRLILANAVYFKADWQDQFKKDETRPLPFHVNADRSVNVRLMSQTHRFDYAKVADGAVQLLEMPYRGRELSMVVLLPRQQDGLADLEKSLTADRLEQWLKAKLPAEVWVMIPKFKLTQELDLKKTLAAMGMRQAFDVNLADLTGMTDARPGLYLDAALHRAVVEVNEEGAEASATTIAKFKDKDGPPGGREGVTFWADHPFLFLIHHRVTGAILFLGRLTEPRE
jgi:serpin B